MLVKYTVQMYGEFFFQIIQGEYKEKQKLYKNVASHCMIQRRVEPPSGVKQLRVLKHFLILSTLWYAVCVSTESITVFVPASNTAKSYLRFSFVWYLSYQRNIHILKIKPKFCNKNGPLAYWEIFLVIVIYYCLAYTIHYR